MMRAAFVVAGGFALLGAGWSPVVAWQGGPWWGPLHAFLAGSVLAAISGATQMFTITWSNAPPPPRRLPVLQGASLLAGVVLVLAGVPSHTAVLVWTGGAAVAIALLLLAVSLLQTIRRSLLRRFDLSIRFYLLALACGVVGVTLGTLLGTGTIPLAAYDRVRLVHFHLNLVGLVGFTILGTLPTLLPTFAHHRMVGGREILAAWWVCLAAAMGIAAGLVAPPAVVGAGTLLAAVALATILGGIVGRLGVRGIDETLPYLHVVAGVGWLGIWAVADGVSLVAGTPFGPLSGWILAAVVAGVGQVLLGSIAYLGPVVLGPPIAANLRRMGHAPALPLAAANLAGVFLVAGIPEGAWLAGGVWFVDVLRRVATLRRPAPRSAG